MLACAVTVTLVIGMAGAARAATPGSLGPSFGAGGIAATGSDSRLFGTAVQGDGKILAVGETGAETTGATLLLARFTSAGALDPKFGVGGVVRGPAILGTTATGSIGRGVVVQADRKIVVVGTATTSEGTGSFALLVERYNPNGSLDARFGVGGVVEVLAGQSFGDGYAVAIQRDGKIIATGSADAAASGGTTPQEAVARLNANGSLDPSFGSGGSEVLDLGPYSYALAVALQTDGKIVLAGSQRPGLQVTSALIARLTPSGALDRSFAGTGWYAHQYAQAASSSAFNAVAVQGDGKVVAAGAALHGDSGSDAVVVRFTSSGAPDGKFGSGSVTYTPAAVYWAKNKPTVPGANGLVIAPNGDIVLAGLFGNSIMTYATLWALTPSGSLDGAFGHNGAAVLTNSDGNNTNYAAIAVSPSNGDFVAAGDAVPFGGSYTGIEARYIGFPLKVSLTGIKRSYKTSPVVDHGLKLTVGCSQACTIKASLTVSAATARNLRLKVDRKGPITIAAAVNTLTGPGARSITPKLSKGVGHALEQQNAVSLTLIVSVTATAMRETQTSKKRITFRR
jgi:uncharacterized delta-60 repeat protein